MKIFPDFYNNARYIFNNKIYNPKAQIKNLNDAILLLGKNKVIETFRFLYIKNKLFNLKKNKNIQMYKSSFLYGLISKTIFEYLNPKNENKMDIFFSALYYNFGKLLLLKYEPGIYLDIENECKSENSCFFEIEKKIFGFNITNKLSEKILNYLEVPEKFYLPTLYYDDIENCKYKMKKLILILTKIIGDGLCLYGDDFYKLPLLKNEYFKLLKLDGEGLKIIFRNFLNQMNSLKSFFKLL